MFDRPCFRSVVLLSDDSTAFVVPKGTCTVTLCLPYQSTTCGLLPIGSPVDSLTTVGLQWDLSDSRLEFGGLVCVCTLCSVVCCVRLSDCFLLVVHSRCPSVPCLRSGKHFQCMRRPLRAHHDVASVCVDQHPRTGGRSARCRSWRPVLLQLCTRRLGARI